MRALWGAAAVLAALGIVGVSSMPAGTMGGGTGSATEQVVSNLLHVPAFAVLTFLWIKTFHLEHAERKPVKRKAMVWLLVALTCFAAMTEVQQAFVPGRFASFMDFVLNLAGILAGWWGTRKVYRPGSAS